MARAMWTGAIQFGLVTIPVRLYLATESKGISFNLLHARDLSRIQMKIFCPVEQQVIPRGETVRGFEWAPGEYVVVTDEDLESVPLRTVRAIEIEQFVKRDGRGADTAESTIRFARQAYYVEPEKVGRKAFALLRSVLDEKRLTAIGKVVIREREVLAALEPFAEAMVLTTLHWPDEIRSVAELDLPAAAELEFRPAERAMAEQLIDAMTAEFDPAQYRDEYREALMAVIEAKVEGRQVASEAEAPAGAVIDLMAALAASVEAARAGRARPVSVADARPGARTTARSTRAAPSPTEAEPGQAVPESAAAPADGRLARRRRSA